MVECGGANSLHEGSKGTAKHGLLKRGNRKGPAENVQSGLQKPK